MTEVESIETVEGDLSTGEIIALEKEIEGRLLELDYIDTSVVLLSYRPEDTSTLCFDVNLIGTDLAKHIGEITDIMEEKLGSCDLEHSSITNLSGEILYPVK